MTCEITMRIAVLCHRPTDVMRRTARMLQSIDMPMDVMASRGELQSGDCSIVFVQDPRRLKGLSSKVFLLVDSRVERKPGVDYDYIIAVERARLRGSGWAVVADVAETVVQMCLASRVARTRILPAASPSRRQTLGSPAATPQTGDLAP